jgi:hypothetical protein
VASNEDIYPVDIGVGEEKVSSRSEVMKRG